MRHEDVIEVLNDPWHKSSCTPPSPPDWRTQEPMGSPRVVPVGFYWDGAQLIVGTTPAAPKVRALAANSKVALTIDTNTQPPHVLLVRGSTSIEVVNGVAPEYLEGAKKLVDEEQWQAFEARVREMYEQMR